jgi:flagellar assembly protein FliH
MSRRLNLTQAVVVPWPIPDIDAAPQPASVSAFLPAELDRPEPAAGPDPAPEVPLPGVAAPTETAAAAETFAEERERALRESRELGHADGFMAGQRAAERQFADQARRIEAIVARLGEPMRSLERPVEEAVIALALEVARWVIGNEITVSRDHLVRLVRDAVAKIPLDVGTPSIVLHAADAELIRTLAPDLENNGIPLVVDDTVEPGGCLIIANGEHGVEHKDRRWHPRTHHAVCEVDLTLASRWRDAMFAMFEGEDA